MSLSRHVVAAAIAAAWLASPRPALGEIAVQVAPGAPDSVFPNGGTTHGWQFTVNVPIEVTHLGLYDRLLDGFAIAHPIGLWDEEGALLVQGVLGPGSNDILIANFRYVNITENTATGGGVLLMPGMTYTVGFYSAVFQQFDGMVIFGGFHTISPFINYAGFGVSGFTDGLGLPANPSPNLHRWGPNLQFTVIPGAGALPVLALAALGARRRRAAR